VTDASPTPVIRCDATHDAIWNGFVAASDRASFYHRAEWRRINEECFGHRTCYLGALDGDRIVGILPLVQVKSRLFGNIGCSLPFVNYGGPCGVDDEVERALLRASEAVAGEWGVDYLEMRSTRPLGEQYPCSMHKVSMTLELQPDPEQVFAAYKGDHRKDIRRAYKYGFVARFGTLDLLDDFYAVLRESWRDLGTPIYAQSYMRRVLEAFPASTRICVVHAEDGTPAAGAFIGEHNGTVEGLWLGTRGQYRRQMVGYVLYWELIRDACLRGQSRFHLGRSTAESGSEQFKRKWNASPKQLYWQYLLRNGAGIPQLNVRNPKYHLAIAAWRKLPVGVTERIGPLIARSIP
jgi:FemAB-related protein (PEP-CTERM system-associated)